MSRCFDVTQFSFTIVFPLITTFYLTYIIFIGFVSLLYVVAVVTSSANSSLCLVVPKHFVHPFQVYRALHRQSIELEMHSNGLSGSNERRNVLCNGW